MEKLTTRFWVITLMVLAAAFVRLIPHPPNFTPIAAIALFGGAYYTKKYFAFIIPLSVMILTDIILGFHSTMWAVYFSFVLIVGLGMFMLRKKNVQNIFAASLISSILFFAITNFAVWLSGTMYPLNIAGLAACYTSAIPFFQNTILGDLIFTFTMFGIFEIVRSKFPRLAEANT